MYSVGKVLETYANKKRFMGYGFGGIPKFMNKKEPSNCFPLTGKHEAPEIKGLSNLLQQYRDSLDGIELYGPTLFDEVIYKVIEFTEKVQGLYYHVLLILTDGGIHDLRKTIDAVSRASEKPISIIIVGIGDGDDDHFRNMETLDADKFVLIDSEGNKASRDIV